ncbi:MAG: tRNA (guanine-N(7)-)-methyltransferase non-catalytic subunit trm82 [Lichina confinis]|nr:MAG: tRNA (guanine-N(7)-)-methyltransferase non-catalytic subunit trm82 [Lichina confinis]
MLTDILLASLENVSEAGPKAHHYIITCDRDEHIRVSRGLPQTHVIESYCLGHKEFVTKLLIPELYPEILISGGGEKHLYLWHWRTGALLKTADISEALMDFVKSNTGPEEPNAPAASPSRDEPAEQARPGNEGEDASNKGGSSFASENGSDDICVVSEDGPGRPVCGIWDLTVSSSSEGQAVKSCRIIIALEGVPALFDFCLASDGSLKHENTLKLAGNVLDASTVEDEASLIVSIDNVHQPFSTTAVRGTEAEHEPLLQCFTLETTGSNMEWREMPKFRRVDCVSRHGSFQVTQAISSRLGDALYTLKNMRKREME